jgi:hypothetical protein
MAAQPVSSHLVMGTNIMPTAERSRNLQITMLAVGILSSLFCLMILPWEIALPLGALLLGACVVLSYTAPNDAWTEPVPGYEQPPVILHERRAPPILFIPPPPRPEVIIVDSAPRAPVGTGQHTRLIHQPPATRAPVGTGQRTPLVRHGEKHAPPGLHVRFMDDPKTDARGGLSMGLRAPVGRK